jgi:hypothetical protein
MATNNGGNQSEDVDTTPAQDFSNYAVVYATAVTKINNDSSLTAAQKKEMKRALKFQNDYEHGKDCQCDTCWWPYEVYGEAENWDYMDSSEATAMEKKTEIVITPHWVGGKDLP